MWLPCGTPLRAVMAGSQRPSQRWSPRRSAARARARRAIPRRWLRSRRRYATSVAFPCERSWIPDWAQPCARIVAEIAPSASAIAARSACAGRVDTGHLGHFVGDREARGEPRRLDPEQVHESVHPGAQPVPGSGNPPRDRAGPRSSGGCRCNRVAAASHRGPDSSVGSPQRRITPAIVRRVVNGP